MTAARRNYLWPLLIAVVGALWLLVTVDWLPDAVGDILLRAWPAALILFGLDLLVGRRRVRTARWGISANVLVFGAALVLLAVVVWLAYDRQADVVRDDKQIPFSEVIADDAAQLRIRASMDRTEISIVPSETDERVVTAEYSGSEQSDVSYDWNVEGEIAALAVTEAEGDSIPELEEYGRGTLDLTLPATVPVQELAVGGNAGNIRADLQAVRIGQLNLAVGEGDLDVTLPADAVMTGVLRTGDGDIFLSVPQNVALTLSLGEGSGQPTYEYDASRYDLLINGTLKLKNTEAFQIGLTVSLPGGARLVVTDVE